MARLEILFLINLLIKVIVGDYFSNGSANPLAIGGNYINRGECPWLCPIYVETSSVEAKYICSSSLVTNKFVLTAAHCVQPKKHRSTQYLPHEYLIYAGKFNLSKRNEPKSKIIHGANIEVHPDWDFLSDRYDGDIALIEMQQPVRFSANFLERIALPTPRILATPGRTGFVVGYGRSETESVHEKIPRRIEIPIVDTETCYQSHFQIGFIKSRDAFCAGKQGSIPCNGDSGGSFYINKGKKAVILGVVSVGITGHTEKPCNDEVYALFADVQKYVEWIKREAGNGLIFADDGGQTEDEDGPSDMENRNTNWIDGNGFCEFKDLGGYSCFLHGIQSTEANFRVSQISGYHAPNTNDENVVNFGFRIKKQFSFLNSQKSSENSLKLNFCTFGVAS